MRVSGLLEVEPSAPPASSRQAHGRKASDDPYVVSANGVAEPMQTVAGEAQVSGILNAVSSPKARTCKRAQVLFQIDARPYAAALAQARAQLTRDEAIAANARRMRRATQPS